ncbi:hypothetical protein BHE74_00024064 [Ensete ventricosum]|nr:hypothetical protein BHE74_00024064 [Ensete ventricosum]RZS02284.1 hypothetical protein BHM03_00032318 [Ensete ventricosum]
MKAAADNLADSTSASSSGGGLSGPSLEPRPAAAASPLGGGSISAAEETAAALVSSRDAGGAGAGVGAQDAVTVERRGYHSAVCRWAVPHFPRAKARAVWSRYFEVGGYDCRLLVYPRGDSQALPGYLSLYLQIVDPRGSSSSSGGNKWDCFASYRLSISNHLDDAKSVARDSWHRFSSKKKSHGWCDFAPFSAVLDPRSGFLLPPSDSLLVTADILLLHETVVFSRDHEPQPPPADVLGGKFTWKVHNFSLFREMIKTQKIMSPVFPAGDCNLRISVYQSSVAAVDHLSMCLESKDTEKTAAAAPASPAAPVPERSCWCLFRMSVLNQRPGSNHMHRDSYGRFAADNKGGDNTSLGWNDYMRMDDFVGPDAGFLVDDTAVFSMTFHKMEEKSVTKESQNRYSKAAKDWGWREFVTLTSLFDQDSGFLVQDTVIFSAEVLILKETSIMQEFNDTEPELAMMCSASQIDAISKRGSFTWRVENFFSFKEIMETRKIFSKFFQAGGCELRIGVYESFDMICIYLESDQSSGSDPDKNFWVRYKMAVVNQKNPAKTVWKESSICTKTWNNSVLQFMKVSDLLESDAGFLFRDTVVFASEDEQDALSTDPDELIESEDSEGISGDEEDMFRNLLSRAGFHLTYGDNPSQPQVTLREKLLIDAGAIAGFLTGLRVYLDDPAKVKRLLLPTKLSSAIIDLLLDIMVECCQTSEGRTGYDSSETSSKTSPGSNGANTPPEHSGDSEVSTEYARCDMYQRLEPGAEEISHTYAVQSSHLNTGEIVQKTNQEQHIFPPETSARDEPADDGFVRAPKVRAFRLRLKSLGTEVPQCVLHILTKILHTCADVAEAIISDIDSDSELDGTCTVSCGTCENGTNGVSPGGMHVGKDQVVHGCHNHTDVYILVEMLSIPGLFVEVSQVFERSLIRGAIGLQSVALVLERRHSQRLNIKSRSIVDDSQNRQALVDENIDSLPVQEDDFTSVLSLGEVLSLSRDTRVQDFVRMLYAIMFKIYAEEHYRFRMLKGLVERATNVSNSCRVVDIDMDVLVFLVREEDGIARPVLNMLREVAEVSQVDRANLWHQICAVEDENIRFREERQEEITNFAHEKAALATLNHTLISLPSDYFVGYFLDWQAELKSEMERFARERKELTEQILDVENQLEWLRSEKDEEIAKLSADRRGLQDRLHDAETQLSQLKTRKRDELKVVYA